MINKIGPSIVPWGTSEITGDQSEQLPLNTTRCLLFVKKFLIHSNREPSIPCRCIFSNKRSCGTLSKALETSKKTISVCCEGLQDFAQSLQHVGNCANVDLPLRYANWSGLKRLRSDQKSTTRSLPQLLQSCTQYQSVIFGCSSISMRFLWTGMMWPTSIYMVVDLERMMYSEIKSVEMKTLERTLLGCEVICSQAQGIYRYSNFLAISQLPWQNKR